MFAGSWSEMVFAGNRSGRRPEAADGGGAAEQENFVWVLMPTRQRLRWWWPFLHRTSGSAGI